MVGSNLAPFLAGVFVTTLLFTHDAVGGNELLVARGLLARAGWRWSRGGGDADPLMTRRGDARDGGGPDPARAGELPRAGDVSARAPPTSPPTASSLGVGVGGGGDDDDDDASSDATTTLRGFYDDVDDGARDGRFARPRARFADDITSREAFTAALASQRLALALFARALRPTTDFVRFYFTAGVAELVAFAWRQTRATDPKVLARVLVAALTLAFARTCALRFRRHLRRAKYLARGRARVGRARRRVSDACAKIVSPFVAARRRASRFARGVTRRYALTMRWIAAKSRVAAMLAPHLVLASVGGAIVATLPDEVRAAVRKREVVASVALLVPTYLTTKALERCRNARVEDPPENLNLKPPTSPPTSTSGGSGGGGVSAGKEKDAPDRSAAEDAMVAAEAWLRYWASAAPLMLFVDLPLVATGLHVFFPWWPECTLLWTAWLTFPMTSGAKSLTTFAAPHFFTLMHGERAGRRRVAAASFSSGESGDKEKDKDANANANASSTTTASMGLSRWIAAPAARARRLLDSGAHRSLKSFAWGLRMCGFRRAGAALTRAVDNTTLPMVGCFLFFFTPSFLTSYGVAVAALVLPTASALDALERVDARGRLRAPRERARRVCAQLRYWLSYSMIWSLARELSRGALSWFPFWRHLELAAVFWLVVFGGADDVAARVVAVKEGIASEHREAAEQARARFAAAEERRRGSSERLGLSGAGSAAAAAGGSAGSLSSSRGGSGTGSPGGGGGGGGGGGSRASSGASTPTGSVSSRGARDGGRGDDEGAGAEGDSDAKPGVFLTEESVRKRVAVAPPATGERRE